MDSAAGAAGSGGGVTIGGFGTGMSGSSRVPLTGQHVSRSNRRSAMRRFNARMALSIDTAAGDVVNQAQTVVGSVFTDQDTGANTITFDLSLYRLHQVTLRGNRTLALINPNVPVNERFAVRLIQDAIGSRTVTWWTTIKWAGGSAPTLTTTAGKTDWFGFVVTGSGTYDGMVIAQNL